MRQPQQLSSQLLSVVECHADTLTRNTVQRLQTNPRTPSYNNLPYGELTYQVNEIYQNLSGWLCDKTDPVIRSWYNELGEKRCREGVPVQELLWALMITKHLLMDYLRHMLSRIRRWNSTGKRSSIDSSAAFSTGPSVTRRKATRARRIFTEWKSQEAKRAQAATQLIFRVRG